MPWLSSRTGSMLPEDVFELFWMIRCMKKMKVTIMLPIGLDDLMVMMMMMKPLRIYAVPIGFDEVMFCRRDPATLLSTLSCTSWKSLINVANVGHAHLTDFDRVDLLLTTDILNTVLIVSESYVVLKEPRCLFFYLILRVL